MLQFHQFTQLRTMGYKITASDMISLAETRAGKRFLRPVELYAAADDIRTDERETANALDKIGLFNASHCAFQRSLAAGDLALVAARMGWV